MISICVYSFELFSQVSNVAHGPLVFIAVLFVHVNYALFLSISNILHVKFLPCLVEIGPVVHVYFVNVFSLFRNYLPLEKGGILHLNKFKCPTPKDALFQVWLNLVQLFLKRRF